jgi:DNA repair protein RecN (Recombination protein N)
MLRELRIRDIAIIEDLSLSFGAGLNVITGETGAGKSIILQSLALLCGARAATDLIRSDVAEAQVEGLFACSPPQDIRDALGLDGSDEILIRRHIARSGKARIYINGSPATLALLGQLGAHLVHLYGQHEQSSLLRPGSHRELLDRFGELGAAADAVAAAHAALTAAQRERDALSRRMTALAERRDILQFQQDELSAAAPRSGEDAALRAERDLLRHATKLQDACATGEATLYSGHGAIVAALGRLQAQLGELAGIAAPLAPIVELIESGRIQLEEAALQLRSVAARLEADPAQLDRIEERLALLQRLSRKYGGEVDQLPEVLAGIGSGDADRQRRRGGGRGRRPARARAARRACAVGAAPRRGAPVGNRDGRRAGGVGHARRHLPRRHRVG